MWKGTEFCPEDEDAREVGGEKSLLLLLRYWRMWPMYCRRASVDPGAPIAFLNNQTVSSKSNR